MTLDSSQTLEADCVSLWAPLGRKLLGFTHLALPVFLKE